VGRGVRAEKNPETVTEVLTVTVSDGESGGDGSAGGKELGGFHPSKIF